MGQYSHLWCLMVEEGSDRRAVRGSRLVRLWVCLGWGAAGLGPTDPRLLCFQPPGCPDYAMLSFMGSFHGRTFGKRSTAAAPPSFPPPCAELSSRCTFRKVLFSLDQCRSCRFIEGWPWKPHQYWNRVFEWQWELILYVLNISFQKVPYFHSECKVSCLY